MSEQSSGADRLLDGLTEEQREVVTSTASPLCVLAGAGSGKTRVLTHRIAWQAASGLIDPQHVLALTFTRRAAGELRKRLRGLGLVQEVAAGTFHASALAMLRRCWAERGERQPTILQRRLSLLKDLRPDWGWASLYRVDDEIAWASRQLISPDEYLERAAAAGRRGSLKAADAAEAYRDYVDAKRERGLVDFDDMLTLARRALISDSRFAAEQHRRQRHLLVDEFQDVNLLQFKLLEAWQGPESTLVVVGDPKQAIFAWNGAEPELLEQIDKHLSGVSVVPLSTNFRSTPQILGAAARILDVEPQPAIKPPGKQPSVRQLIGWVPEGADTAIYEAREIVKAVLSAHRAGARWSRQAVLARTNKQLPPIEAALTEAGIPVRKHDKKLARREIRQIESLLEQYEPTDELSLLITNLSTEASAVEAKRNAEDGHVRTEDCGWLRASLLEFARDAVALDPSGTVDDLRLALDDDEGWLPLDDGVDLSTIHKAKGLEWPIVHIVGAEEGYLPHYWSRNESALKEDQRLFYVAVTRAEQVLNVSWCRIRTRGSRTYKQEPSPWLGAVDDRTGCVNADPCKSTSPVVTTREAPVAKSQGSEDSHGPEGPLPPEPEAPSHDAAAGTGPEDSESQPAPEPSSGTEIGSPAHDSATATPPEQSVHTGRSVRPPLHAGRVAGGSVDELLAGLSDDQRKAVTSEAQSLAVTGGPGSGKTLVLARRIAWPVATGAIEAERIVAVTHSQRAAGDLRRKLQELEVSGMPRAGSALDATMAAIYNRQETGELRRELKRLGSGGPAIGTLADVAQKLLARFRGDTTGRGENFPPIEKRWDLLAGLHPEWTWRKLAALDEEIGWARACMLTPAEYPDAAFAAGRRRLDTAEVVGDQYRAYNEHKRKHDMMDQDDALSEMARVLRSSAHLASGLHLLIDEFEESNLLQLDVVKAWSGSDAMFTVTGDPDQSIYGWTGAEPGLLREIRHHLPVAEVVNLTYNFRSAPDIAEAVSRIGGCNPSSAETQESDALTLGELLGSEVSKDLPVSSYPELEAERVAQAVLGARRPGEPWNHQAVLTFKKDQIKSIRGALAAAGIPSRTLNSKRQSSDNVVNLSTIHAAKGLEWPIVHVVGVEDGHCPHHQSKTASAINADRRLLYVAASRAQRELRIYWCRFRKKGRKVIVRRPSPFIEGLLDVPGIRRGDGANASDSRRSAPSEALERPEVSVFADSTTSPSLQAPSAGSHQARPEALKGRPVASSLPPPPPPPPSAASVLDLCRRCRANGDVVVADIESLCMAHYVEARQSGLVGNDLD